MPLETADGPKGNRRLARALCHEHPLTQFLEHASPIDSSVRPRSLREELGALLCSCWTGDIERAHRQRPVDHASPDDAARDRQLAMEFVALATKPVCREFDSVIGKCECVVPFSRKPEETIARRPHRSVGLPYGNFALRNTSLRRRDGRPGGEIRAESLSVNGDIATDEPNCLHRMPWTNGLVRS